jgi:hypothetical protein
MKKIIFVLFLAVLLSCSEDKENNEGNDLISYIYTLGDGYSNNLEVETCREFLISEIEEPGYHINDVIEYCEQHNYRFFYSGCSGGSVIKCKMVDARGDTLGGVFYFYDEKLKGMTCDEIRNYIH